MIEQLSGESVGLIIQMSTDWIPLQDGQFLLSLKKLFIANIKIYCQFCLDCGNSRNFPTVKDFLLSVTFVPHKI